MEAAHMGRRTLVALALVGPLVTVAVASAAVHQVAEHKRAAVTARDLTTLFGAAYGVLEGAESIERALGAALGTRDSGLRYVPQYQAAAAAMREDLETVERLAGLVPECARAAREVVRPFADASRAADRVVTALRSHDQDRAVVAGYEFQAAITLTRDAARAMVEVARAALPRRLIALTSAPVQAGAAAPLWAGGLGAAAAALVFWGALARSRMRPSETAST
jgi:hypothetical protein